MLATSVIVGFILLTFVSYLWQWSLRSKNYPYCDCYWVQLYHRDINLHPPKLFTNVVSQVGAKKTPFLKRLSNRYFSRYLPNSFFVVLSNFLATISILYFVDRFIWIYVFLSIFGLEMMTKYVKHEISWKVLVIDQIGYHNRILRTKIHKYTSF